MCEESCPLIHPDTGNEIKKQFFVSVPYFPGLSESFKKIFKYTTIQVCFKGVNTLKSMLMHPKDKISIKQKKDVSTSESARQNLSHTETLYWPSPPLPSISNFNIIDKDPSKSLRRQKKQYTFQWWTLISTEILVKCPSHIALTTYLVLKPNILEWTFSHKPKTL